MTTELASCIGTMKDGLERLMIQQQLKQEEFPPIVLINSQMEELDVQTHHNYLFIVEVMCPLRIENGLVMLHVVAQIQMILQYLTIGKLILLTVLCKFLQLFSWEGTAIINNQMVYKYLF